MSERLTDTEWVAGRLMRELRAAVRDAPLTRDQQTDAMALFVKAWIEFPEIVFRSQP